MAQIDVRTEVETTRGWRYEIAVTRDAAPAPASENAAAASTAVRTTQHVVTLSWADHQHWSGGALPPSRLIESVIAYLLDREDDQAGLFALPRRFDAATARRWFPSIDHALGARA